MIESIGESCFSGCSSLLSVNLPHVAAVSPSCFLGCSSLEDVVLPKATSIGAFSFASCGKLKSINIPSVNRIANRAFQNCQSIDTLRLPRSLEVIGESAFLSCTNLVSLYIPENVAEIGENAFIGCRQLMNIHCEIKNPFAIPLSVFEYDTFMKGELYVPEESKWLYLVTEGWKYFSEDRTHAMEKTAVENKTLPVPTIDVNDSGVVVSGVPNDSYVRLFSVNGMMLDSQRVQNGRVVFRRPLTNLVIVKVANCSICIVL